MSDPKPRDGETVGSTEPGKLLVTLNGGAIIALMTFWGNSVDALHPLWASRALWLYALGVALAAWGVLSHHAGHGGSQIHGRMSPQLRSWIVRLPLFQYYASLGAFFAATLLAGSALEKANACIRVGLPQ